ncbi:MAG TPA: lipase [Anaerolineaceae bacterium]|nr:lipase [Anaerolineaceae bacterium]
MAEELLRVDGIIKRFGGVTALDDVSFSINKGESLTLVGENGSGKSTMIKIISGVYTPDEGDIFINGNHYKKMTPIDSIKEGVQVIYQDFSLFPNLTVAENIALNDLIISGAKTVNWKKVHDFAREGLEKIKVKIPLNALVGELSTADRQLIAISKAILADAKLLIMDEPTTALTRNEVKALFKVVKELNTKGIASIFVSHKLTEVREIGERTIILRNGRKIIDEDAKGLDVKTIEYQMTGRHIDTSSIEYSKPKQDDVLMKVENLNLSHGFFDVSFELHRNEVLGITGLLGSGRTELALALFGQKPADSGTIILEGKEIKIKSIFDATSNGIGFVPEDRIKEGLFLPQTINNNIAAKVIDTLKNKFGLLDLKKKVSLSEEWIKRLNVKTPTGELPASSLSGGNQQRLVLAKWLAFDPKVLILNGPTVGVDVGSKADIHELIRKLASEGMGIILMSDDIPELMHTCNRILLMRRGRIVEDFQRETTNEEDLNNELVASDVEEEAKR